MHSVSGRHLLIVHIVVVQEKVHSLLVLQNGTQDLILLINIVVQIVTLVLDLKLQISIIINLLTIVIAIIAQIITTLVIQMILLIMIPLKQKLQTIIEGHHFYAKFSPFGFLHGSSFIFKAGFSSSCSCNCNILIYYFFFN